MHARPTLCSGPSNARRVERRTHSSDSPSKILQVWRADPGVRYHPDMAGYGFTLFDTSIGRCGIAWSTRGVAGEQLPEGRDSATRARLLQRFPDGRENRPPPPVQRAVDGMAGLLRGQPSDLSGVVLDMERVTPFHRRVYETSRAIPPGATLSYGEIATRIGQPGAARAVGQALGRNPFAIVVPCHRVVAANGKLGGFSAAGGVKTKLELLAIERGAGPLFETV